MGGLGLIFLVVLALVIAAGAMYQRIGAARDTRRFPAPGSMIDLGHHRLHAEIKGSGSTAVVFEAGVAATSLSWSLVQDEIAKSAQTIAYDRAGLGWSDSAESCNLEAILADLRALLDRAQIASPRIVVGHSFGGLIALAYAARYPQEVAGLVLVDPAGASGLIPRKRSKRRAPMASFFRASASCSRISA
jgi:pimeloyl-ACP methyl ester carboxylesterase